MSEAFTNGMTEITMAKLAVALRRKPATRDHALAIVNQHFDDLEMPDDETPLEMVGISQWVCTHLYNHGVFSVEQLCGMSYKTLIAIDGIKGRWADDVVRSLANSGLHLAGAKKPA